MKIVFRRSTSGSAFTLIEVVISAALMALIAISAYLCFSAGIASKKTLEPRLEVIQNARVAMALMSADLRAACPLDKNSQFLGMHRTMGGATADNLDFATHNYTPRNAREGDFCQLSYYVDHDPETGLLSLWRRRNPLIAPDPLTGGNKEEIATGLLGLRFEYFDGLDWYESWGDPDGRGKAQTSQRTQPNLSGMPDAVRITLWFDSNPRKKTAKSEQAREETSGSESALVFQTVTRLNLAHVSQPASSSTEAPNSTEGTTPAVNPGGGS